MQYGSYRPIVYLPKRSREELERAANEPVSTETAFEKVIEATERKKLKPLSRFVYSGYRVAKWRDQIRASDIADDRADSDQDGFRTALIILAAMEMDTQREVDLITLTRLPLEFVSPCCERLRANGIWNDGQWAIEDPERAATDAFYANVGFAIWVLVAQGKVVRTPPTDEE